MNLFFRIVTITLFIILHSYWRLKDKGIEKAFDFGKNPLQSIFHKSALSYAQVIVLLQLTVLTIFPFPSFPPVLQLVTVLVSVTGLTICIVARRALGNNWINAKDYQLHKNPQLVTNGVYKHIRHPIYLGVNLMLTGAELLTNTYLIILLPFIYFWTYKQAKKEEQLLLTRFGKDYENYLAKTKMFLPYIF